MLKLIVLLYALFWLWVAEIQRLSVKVSPAPCVVECTTDSDCKAKNGGNGDPVPVASPLPLCGKR